MLKQSLVGLSLIAFIMTVNAQAFDFKGTSTAKMPITSHVVRGKMALAPANFKTVVLMKANLSASEKRAFTTFNPRLEKSLGASTVTLPTSIDLGMNNVPVLDQGLHGTCVTFAVTAAMDALLGKGDHVSQLCNLELGSYLEAHSDMPSGWDGSLGSYVMNQVLNFGYITTDKQKAGVCSGVTIYPVNDGKNMGDKMSLDDFHMAREKAEDFYWEPILSPLTRILNMMDHGYHAEQVLQETKKALATELTNRKARVTFGVLLPTSHCFAGACAQRNKPSDTWALTDDINYDIFMPQLEGHEMVITGYDDNATVTDNEGKMHQGLFILRNSWGSDVGDGGNFYMTYDFFKKFVFEVQEIVYLKDTESQQQNEK